jgi:NADPH:quinone reductase-like Zn-dependent oxidoreductase
MKVIEVRQGFGLDQLTLAERPDPEPGAGEVLLRMRTASLNFRDLLMVRGEYDPRQPLPLIPCSDGLGEVAAVGRGVERVVVGQRVTPLFAQRWQAGRPTREELRSTLGGPLDGTLAQWMVLAESGVVAVPEHLTDAEGSTLSCAGLTAWSALVTEADLDTDDIVLIQGTGGVSLFALQFSRVLGLRAIVTSSSDEKLERARELGAWRTINYRTTPEWGRRVLELTEKRGVDLVVEVGGAGTLEQSLKAVRLGGQISLIGVLAGGVSRVSVIPIFMKRVRIQGILVGHREGFEAMNRTIASHELRPILDRVHPMEQVREAFEQMAAGRLFGKIGIEIPQ